MEQWQRGELFENIKTIHLVSSYVVSFSVDTRNGMSSMQVYMVHLDIGFTNLGRKVCEQYFDEHYPSAIALAKALEARGGPERYAWTSHPWMIQVGGGWLRWAA